MIMMIGIFLLSGLIKHVSSIQCYTCTGPSYHCTLPLNLDAGDESNESEIDLLNYDPGHACLSDYSYNPKTGHEKLILRGIQDCTEVHKLHHRAHCCYTNCNKQLPAMIYRTLTNNMPKERQLESNSQRSSILSIQLILFSMILQYFY